MSAVARPLSITEVIQLPAELEGRGRSVEQGGKWLRHARHLGAAAQFVLLAGGIGGTADVVSAVSDDWLDTAGREELLEEINEYVKATYEGPLRTAEHRLDTARRRIARGETVSQYQGDLENAVSSAHDYRGAAESRQARHEVAYADLILAETHALLADRGEAVDRAERAFQLAASTLEDAIRDVAEAAAKEQMLAYQRALKRFEQLRPSCELVLLSAATFLDGVGQRPSLYVAGEGTGSLERPNKALSAWRDGRDAFKRWTAERQSKKPKGPERPIV